MARGNRPQASRGHRHGRTGRRTAPAEKTNAATQAAEQTEIPAQVARVTARRLGSIETSTLIWRQSCRAWRRNFISRALAKKREAASATGWRSPMQLNAFFPSLDIG